jgi:glycerate-2-kinase
LITDKNLKDTILSIIESGINAVKPERLMKEKINYHEGILFINNETFDLKFIDKVYVIGFGKLSDKMAYEIEKILGNRIAGGLVITNNYNCPKLEFITIRIGEHPILDEKTLAASREIISICNAAKENDLIICLISGGGSALFEKLPEEIDLSDMQIITGLLLNSGASINEINSVRKCFSLVKNGGLLTFIHPAKCIALIISDVVGNDIGSIASSPTYPVEDSIRIVNLILEKYRLLGRLPINLVKFMNHKLKTENIETISDNFFYSQVHNFIIGTNQEAILASEKKAKQYQLNTIILTDKIQGEAKEVAKLFENIIKKIGRKDHPVSKPACFIAGGETTVTVHGKGIGGRNQELALAVLTSLMESDVKFGFASCGSDGIDGITNVAGGYIDHNKLEKIKTENLQPLKYLNDNDSFHLLEIIDGCIYIEPNQSNIMDLMIGIVY